MTAMLAIRKVVALLVPIFTLSLALAQAPQDLIASIASALRDREFEKALEFLRPALKQSPGNAELWTMQGVAYAGRGQTKEAASSFRSALKISPDDIPALQGAAQMAYEAADPSGIPLLKHLHHLRPTDATTSAMLAVLEYQEGNCKSAVQYFAVAGTVFDAKPEGLHAYATCLVRLKRFDEASRVLQKSLNLNPSDGRERQLLAAVQLMAHKPQDALATLDPLLGASTADAGALDLASAAYEDAHDTEKAVESLRQAILLDPQNVNFYLDFAAISATHQSFNVGINVVNEGINLQPKAAPLYFARGVLHVQLAEYDKAQADFEKAYELDPNQSLSAAAQGLAAVQQNDLDHALANVQQKLAHHPDDPILLYLQADVLTQKGAEPGSPEFQTALRAARKSVALRPTLGPARGVLAKLYLQSGHYAEAAVECRKALESDPKDQSALYHLIQALRKSGKNSEIPDLLKRLSQLRQEATKEERDQYRYKLVEGDVPAK